MAIDPAFSGENTMRIAIALLAVLLLSSPAFAQRPLSLRLEEQRPYAIDISGSYGVSPTVIIFRDAMFGGLLGLAGGAVVGFAADSDHVARDCAIGAGVGLLLGAAFRAYDAESGPPISGHADRVGLGGRVFGR